MIEKKQIKIQTKNDLINVENVADALISGNKLDLKKGETDEVP